MVKYHTLTDRTYRYNKRSNIKCINELSSEINKKVEENNTIRRSLVDTVNKCKRINSSYCFVHKNYTDIYNSYNDLLQDFTNATNLNNELKNGNQELTNTNNILETRNTDLNNTLVSLETKYNDLLFKYDELLDEYVENEIQNENENENETKSI